MEPRVEPCPFLPGKTEGLDYRVLQQHGMARDAAFYLDALRYGQVLWMTGHAGRALLALTRALYADVREGETVLAQWPLPYAAMRWILEHHGSDDFPGNPRVSFQHQASRLRGQRQDQRSARAWAVWGLVRVARPALPGDERQAVVEPSFEEIFAGLEEFGLSGEAQTWEKALDGGRW